MNSYAKWSLVCVLFSATGCASDGTRDAQEREQLASSAQAILGGDPTWAVELTGVAVLDMWSFAQNDWSSFCTATMLSNRVALTAKHCTSESITYGKQIHVRVGANRIGVAQLIPFPAEVAPTDVALLRLSTPMPLFDELAGAFTTTGYRRPIHGGTDAELAGRTLWCFGIGQLYDQPTNAFFTARYEPNRITNRVETPMNAREQWHTNGDSGGPCFLTDDGGGYNKMTIASVVSSSPPMVYPPIAKHAGAEEWRAWATWITAALGN